MAKEMTKETPKKQSRGKNFSEMEDGDLCKAWAYVSTDPVTGNGLKAETFWERISLEFNKNRSECRTNKSLMNRWTALAKMIGKFRGCYTNATNEAPSGTNEDDTMKNALELYQVECGKPFERVSCWDILQHEPKFAALVEVDCDATTAKENTRPFGTKKAKAAAYAAKKEEEILKSILSIVTESAAKRERESKKMMTIMEHQMELNLMSAVDDELSREYLNMKRRRILLKMQNSETINEGTNDELEATNN